jgi:multidrug efflux pump subunit AcrB
VAQQLEPSWRKPAGALGIIAWIFVWIVLVATFSRWIGALPVLAQLPIYVVTGIVWIMPLKPVLQWMETGRWRY